MNLVSKRTVAIGAGAAAAVGLTAVGLQFTFGSRNAITQGGSPWGGPVNWWLARRGVIGFGVKEAVVGNPMGARERWKRVSSIKRAEETVRTMENAVFYQGARQVGSKMHIGYDNGPDAFRHTASSALISYRLMRDTGASAEESLRLLDKVGNAHEADSFLALYDPIHARYSSEMDVFNNNVGSRLGVELAHQHAALGAEELARMSDEETAKLPAGFRDALAALDPGERIVVSRVLTGIEEGKSVSMTPLPGVQYRDADHPDAPKGIHQAPHPTSAADIYITDPGGVRHVRTMAPHAAGYPQPFKDGKFVPGAERVPMNLHQLLRRPKPEAPAASH